MHLTSMREDIVLDNKAPTSEDTHQSKWGKRHLFPMHLVEMTELGQTQIQAFLLMLPDMPKESAPDQ